MSFNLYSQPKTVLKYIIYFNDFHETKIYLYAGHKKHHRNFKMADFVSERALKLLHENG